MSNYLTNLVAQLQQVAELLERIIADLKEIQALSTAATTLKLTLGTQVQQ